MREKLRAQLSAVLQTRETARGLIMNMSDVLFDFNKYTLKPDAREKLAKVSGILLAYPNLQVQVEGYTDNIGSDDYNQKLSEQRAGSVKDYLVSQSVPQNDVTAQGYGKSDPVADNSTEFWTRPESARAVSGFRRSHRHPGRSARRQWRGKCTATACAEPDGNRSSRVAGDEQRQLSTITEAGRGGERHVCRSAYFYKGMDNISSM